MLERARLLEHVHVESKVGIACGANGRERAEDGETHGAHVADVDKLLVTEASGSIVDLHFGRIDELFAGAQVGQVEPK